MEGIFKLTTIAESFELEKDQKRRFRDQVETAVAESGRQRILVFQTAQGIENLNRNTVLVPRAIL